jgi:tRNA threonylcarbamoyl adenosine modification protein (Sua5/YciO/YrdC/YwlC family)
MAQFFTIHPTNPQKRLIRQAADIVRHGGLLAYPTDSCYALGCDRGNAKGAERLRRIRGVGERHHLTLMCRDLSEIGRYAIVNDAQFKLLKSVTPGSYTFILRARREVPRRLTSKKTIGVRVPGHPVAHALLAELDQPMLSATLILPGDAVPLSDAQEIRRRLERELDLVIDSGSCGVEPSTVIDLTADVPRVLREGKGSLAPFVVERV